MKTTLLLATMVMVSATACAPILADRAIESAQSTLQSQGFQASRKRDPYRFQMAQLLLEEAIRQNGRGHHQRAVILADEANTTAQSAAASASP